ncbi:MAG: YaaR family protein [Treponema sp.]|jgi:uncharacterized protein YaaR (DUF327 family)|nr:YaaR family protein [Treponema sp.]
MDKIDTSIASLITPTLQPGGPKPKKAGSELRAKGKTLFSKILEQSTPATGELGPLREIAQSDEALTELMDAVHSAGSDLADRPFHDEILRYKKAVRDFINYVVKYAFEVEKSQTLRKGKKKINVQIQVIDRKLEELAAVILSGQTNQLMRVSKIDEIKGLLVDLTITGVIRERDV